VPPNPCATAFLLEVIYHLPAVLSNQPFAFVFNGPELQDLIDKPLPSTISSVLIQF